MSSMPISAKKDKYTTKNAKKTATQRKLKEY